MRRIAVLMGILPIVVLLILAGCTKEIERPRDATPSAVPVAPTPTSAVAGEIPAGLFLKITNLPKESVVRTGTVSISGLTTPDALVSVNGVLVDVDGDGAFMATVSLLQEPNLIEIIASDFQGNKVSAVLTIIYIP